MVGCPPLLPHNLCGHLIGVDDHDDPCMHLARPHTVAVAECDSVTHGRNYDL